MTSTALSDTQRVFVERPDLVIRGAMLIDGTGAPAVRADIGIRGDRITAIAPDLSEMTPGRWIDADGMVVTPGFIDVHSHSDMTLVIDPRAQSAIAQGVTTELVGNCGHGCAPMTQPERHADNIYGHLPGWPVDWTSFAGYLDALDAAGPAVNVAALVAHGSVRLEAMRDPGGRASAAERSVMSGLIDDALDAGAVGLSTGLEYPLEAGEDGAGIASLCAPVARRGRLYATHTRNKDVRAVDGVSEAVDTARRVGVRLQVSHLLPRPGSPPDALERSMDVIDAGIADGLDIGFDIHTRLFGFTNLSVALPSWVTALSPDAMRDVLRHRRSELAGHHSIIDSFGLTGYDGVYITDAPATPEVAGRSVAHLAGVTRSPRDVVLDVLAAHADQVDGPMCIGWSYSVDQIGRAARHPRCSPSSDATTLGIDGPLAGRVFHGAFSWAAWYLETIVGARHDLTLEAAVQRMTGLPAERIGLVDRGTLRVGAWADVLVFDPLQVRATATFERPNVLATGMRQVIVNGRLTIDEGRPTGLRAGRVLRATDR